MTDTIVTLAPQQKIKVATGPSQASAGSIVIAADIPAAGGGAAHPAAAGPDESVASAVEPPASAIAYPQVSIQLTQEGPAGIRYDFNNGIRVSVPQGKWLIRLKDIDTGNVIFQTEASDVTANSRKRHFLNGRIEVEQNGQLVFQHDYSAKGKKVAVHLPVGTLGDSMGWFPYAARFQEVHGCELTVTMAPGLIPLFRDAYPDIHCITPKEFEAIRGEFYASYYIGLFFHDDDNTWQPADFRMVGLHRTAGYILGVDPTEVAPRISIPDGDKRPIKEPYVVIAVQSSTQCKYWNNPYGWREVITNLKARGYRVVCIDQRPVVGHELMWNYIPHGVEDETGDRPLTERARWLKHAEFFIGLSSGLSWLAWAAGTPVVMISGFTHPTNEFHTPYRVFNSHTCNSCWHDIRHPFDHKDFMFCPRHKGTPRQFECTKLITPGHVIRTIETIPNVAQVKGAHKRMSA